MEKPLEQGTLDSTLDPVGGLGPTGVTAGTFSLFCKVSEEDLLDL